MSVKVRKYSKGRWEVDIRFEWPDGTHFRERRCAPGSSRSAAQRWGDARERELLLRGKPKTEEPILATKEVPTVAEFAPRFISSYCVANRQKPSGIASKETIIRIHLVPRIGLKRLSELRNEDIQRIKGELAHRNAKTVNNVLTVLGKMLKVATEWEVIDHLPCRVGLLKVTHSAPPWYEAHEYQRLVVGARKSDPRIELMVLLGGDAGLRRGEIIALRWCDVDLERGMLLVQRSVWKGHETVPKGGRGRTVPMTGALRLALKAHRHLRGERVLLRDDGGEITAKVVRKWMERAQRRAGLEVTGAVHRLRHTFCSILSAKGAPAKAIQELAGHADLTTTMKYMHLSPAARESAIRLLDQVRNEVEDDRARGDILETGSDRPLSS